MNKINENIIKKSNYTNDLSYNNNNLSNNDVNNMERKIKILVNIFIYIIYIIYIKFNRK